MLGSEAAPPKKVAIAPEPSEKAEPDGKPADWPAHADAILDTLVARCPQYSRRAIAAELANANYHGGQALSRLHRKAELAEAASAPRPAAVRLPALDVGRAAESATGAQNCETFQMNTARTMRETMARSSVASVPESLADMYDFNDLPSRDVQVLAMNTGDTPLVDNRTSIDFRLSHAVSEAPDGRASTFSEAVAQGGWEARGSVSSIQRGSLTNASSTKRGSAAAEQRGSLRPGAAPAFEPIEEETGRRSTEEATVQADKEETHPDGADDVFHSPQPTPRPAAGSTRHRLQGHMIPEAAEDDEAHAEGYESCDSAEEDAARPSPRAGAGSVPLRRVHLDSASSGRAHLDSCSTWEGQSEMRESLKVALARQQEKEELGLEFLDDRAAASPRGIALRKSLAEKLARQQEKEARGLSDADFPDPQFSNYKAAGPSLHPQLAAQLAKHRAKADSEDIKL